jgi:hypothetical protein
MPKRYPALVRRDVVTVARRNEAPRSQIAKDVGIFMPVPRGAG